MFIGLAQKPEVEEWLPTDSKIGGKPCYYHSYTAIGATVKCCSDSAMLFVMQLYAPLDILGNAAIDTKTDTELDVNADRANTDSKIDDVVTETKADSDRTVYLFCCSRCHDFKAFSLSSTINHSTAATSASSPAISAAAISAPPPNNSAVCKVCGVSARFQCSSCKSAFYCSKEHQLQHWPAHNCANTYTTLLPEYEIVPLEISEDVDEPESGDDESDEEDECEGDAESAETRDKNIQDSYFEQVLGRHPTQVVRYLLDSPDLVLLPQSNSQSGSQPHKLDSLIDKHKPFNSLNNNVVNQDDCCSGPLELEFQVTPQILHYTKLQTDFATLLVYSCLKCGHCSVKPIHYNQSLNHAAVNSTLAVAKSNQ